MKQITYEMRQNAIEFTLPRASKAVVLKANMIKAAISLAAPAAPIMLLDPPRSSMYQFTKWTSIP